MQTMGLFGDSINNTTNYNSENDAATQKTFISKKEQLLEQLNIELAEARLEIATDEAKSEEVLLKQQIVLDINEGCSLSDKEIESSGVLRGSYSGNKLQALYNIVIFSYKRNPLSRCKNTCDIIETFIKDSISSEINPPYEIFSFMDEEKEAPLRFESADDEMDYILDYAEQLNSYNSELMQDRWPSYVVNVAGEKIFFILFTLNRELTYNIINQMDQILGEITHKYGPVGLVKLVKYCLGGSIGSLLILLQASYYHMFEESYIFNCIDNHIAIDVEKILILAGDYIEPPKTDYVIDIHEEEYLGGVATGDLFHIIQTENRMLMGKDIMNYLRGQ